MSSRIDVPETVWAFLSGFVLALAVVAWVAAFMAVLS